MKKIVIAILSVLLGLNVVAAQGVSSPWTGDTAASFAGGTGTQDDPYLITTGAHLMLLTKTVTVSGGNKYDGIYFRMENDIDLGGALEEPTQYVSIGRLAFSFNGIFDGNNKKIYNIYQSNADRGGVFGSLGENGIVKNLTVASGSISSSGTCGGIVGSCRSSTKQTRVENCRNYADVTALGTGSAGGIVGETYGLVEHCVNYGTITGKTVGGLSGKSGKPRNVSYEAKVSECVNFGRLVLPPNSTSGTIGGIVGELAGAEVSDCAHFGTIDVGRFEGTESLFLVSGLVGSFSDAGSVLKNSIAAGNVYVEAKNINGIAATSSTVKPENAQIENCYNDMQISGQPVPFLKEGMTGGVCLPTDSLTVATAFPGWDATVWNFTERAYPVLKYFENDPTVKIGSVVPFLSYTDLEVYDVFNAIRKDFEVPATFGATWSLEKGTTVTLEGSTAKVQRLADRSDTLVLRATLNGEKRSFVLVTLMESVPLTIVKPENGQVKVYDGETEIVDGGKVEENTLLRLEAVPDEGWLLDYFLVDGERYEVPTFILKAATTVSAVFMKDEDPEPWDGTSIATAFSAGLGTEVSPWQIRTPAELAFLAQEVNAGNIHQDEYFILVFNLDLNKQEWTPIGLRGESDATSYGFGGNFDGRGKTVKNLSIRNCSNSYVGLWGNTDRLGYIRNLNVDSGYIQVADPTANVGMLVGNARVYLENCRVSGRIEGEAGVVGGLAGSAGVSTTACISGVNLHVKASSVGGIAGNMTVASMTDCANIADSLVAEASFVGGIVGNGGSSKITACYNAAVIVTTGYAGGIGGMLTTTGTLGSSTVAQCYNSGTISAKEAGGLVGFAGCSVRNSFNVGDVTGTSSAGGIVPVYSSPKETIAEVYNLGTVRATDSTGLAGEIMGQYQYGTLRNCYFDKQIDPSAVAIGSRVSDAGWELITRQFTDSLPLGFSEDLWENTPGRYPVLKGLEVSDFLNLKSAALVLHAANDTVYDIPDNVRRDIGIFTSTGVNWQVEEGTALSVDGDALKVSAKEVVDTVVVSAVYKNYEKKYRLLVSPMRYRLLLAQSEGGTIEAVTVSGEKLSSGAELNPNDTVILSYTLATGYDFVKWFDDNTEASRRLVMDDDKTVSAVFSKQSFTITASAGEGGSIAPSGESKVLYGESLTYTIMPADGYEADSLIVDRVAVPFQTAYTFANVDADHSIRAVFKTRTFKITASCGAHGSITPAGDTMIAYGQSITYSIKADAGYKLDKLTVDEVQVELTDSYTFNRVVGAHTIHAEFVEEVGVEDVLAKNLDIRAVDGRIAVGNRMQEAVDVAVYNTAGLLTGTSRIPAGTTAYIPVSATGMYAVKAVCGKAVTVRKVMSL